MIDVHDLGGAPAPPRPFMPAPAPEPAPAPLIVVPDAVVQEKAKTLWARFRNSLGPVLIVAAIVGLVSANVWQMMRDRTPTPPQPAPVTDYDPAFVPIGQRLAKQFGADYAAAVLDGTKLLDGGQSRAMANENIADTFTKNRIASFESIAAPTIGEVVPQSKVEKDITPDERAKLARAYRGLAVGATKP